MENIIKTWLLPRNAWMDYIKIMHKSYTKVSTKYLMDGILKLSRCGSYIKLTVSPQTRSHSLVSSQYMRHARTHARKLMAAPINHCSAPSLPVSDGLTHICSLRVWSFLPFFIWYGTNACALTNFITRYSGQNIHNISDLSCPGSKYIRFLRQVQLWGVRLLSSIGGSADHSVS